MQIMEQKIAHYLLDYEYQKGLDHKTLKAYRIDLAQSVLFLAQVGLSFVAAYIVSLHQGYKPRSIRRKVASVKAFCGYFEYEELLKENPFTKLRLKLEPPLVLPRTIPLSDIEGILAAAYRMKVKTSG